MANPEDSLWLGSNRKPIRKAMFSGLVLFGALTLYLILGALFFDTGIGMKQFLSPLSNMTVFATLITGTATILLAAIYFSDFQGAIEPRPSGFFDFVSLICSRVTMIAVVSIVVVMFYEVVSRYVFNAPTLWANELSLWLAGFVFMLAGLYAMQQRSHIRIYVIYDMFPRWAQKASDVLSVSLLWVFTVSLIWGGFNESYGKLMRMETFGTAWDPPIPATIKPAILFIVLLVSIQAVSNLIADWHKAPESHTPMDDIDESEIEHIRQTLKD